MFATWENYFVGGLYLGYVNGPIEGILAVAGTQLIAFRLGHAFFHQTLFQFLSNYMSPNLAQFLPQNVGKLELWLIITGVTFILAIFNSLLKYVSLLLSNLSISLVLSMCSTSYLKIAVVLMSA